LDRGSPPQCGDYIDLCVVPTMTFECLFAFLIMSHGRRQLLWFAVTRHPTAEWLAQQVVEAFPWETAPTYLVRDNDGAATLKIGVVLSLGDGAPEQAANRLRRDAATRMRSGL
jgi:hypothetical protein